MRKSEIMALLDNIDGDPEIMLWNGLVNDYMPIKEVCLLYLYMPDPKKIRAISDKQRTADNKSPLSDDEFEIVKKRWSIKGWELKTCQREIDMVCSIFRKPVIMLYAGRRNKVNHSRNGDIRY